MHQSEMCHFCATSSIINKLLFINVELRFIFILSVLILILQIVCCIYHLYYLLLKYFCKALILILISGSCLDNITHLYFIFHI